MDLSSQLIPNMQTGPNWSWTDGDLSISLLILLQPTATPGQELASVSRRKWGPRSLAGSLVSTEPIPLISFLPPKPWGILQSPTSLSLPADPDHLKRDGGSQPSSGISRVIQSSSTTHFRDTWNPSCMPPPTSVALGHATHLKTLSNTWRAAADRCAGRF